MIAIFLGVIFIVATWSWVNESVYANGASSPFSNQTVIFRLDEMKTDLNGLRHELQTMQKQLEAMENKLQKSTKPTQGKSGDTVTQLQQDVSSIHSTLTNRLWFEVGGFLILASLLGYVGFKMRP
ncbi:hypothetical protein [Candidatus Nitronereus thalassa]|uniref:Uncharacterized protein n=1 Tax=Candidatus Nitronereus thalassa TaxID=3020898 RepID=A0ABU3KBG2_9BACT|nr:hypothetical protein [Candidatus Nitronereus thalassa]MDT7043747.1 hypothetical protein [Candidatus Nitronereus thalassa]